MAKVLFKFGTQAQYLALENKQSNALYFLTDTGELYRGELPISRSHIYSGARTANATNQEMITSLTAGRVLAADDLVIIQNSNSSVDAFIYTNAGTWMQISSSVVSDLSNRISALEDTVAATSGVFHFKDVVEDLNDVTNPEEGDVYQVDNSEYVWNGNRWIELGPSLTGLARASDVASLEALLGHPADDTQTPAVPATGLYAELANTPEALIPLFNGTIAGLVPVASSTLTNSEKANMYLNALGNWVTVTSSGGSTTYTDPETGVVYNTIEEYVSYLVEKGELEWEELEDINNSGN